MIFFLISLPSHCQSHQLVSPVATAQHTAGVSVPTPAASTVSTTVCAAPTVNATGEIRQLQNDQPYTNVIYKACIPLFVSVVAPDTSTYQYDEASGYYYDPQTGLYYDPSSQVCVLS